MMMKTMNTRWMIVMTVLKLVLSRVPTISNVIISRQMESAHQSSHIPFQYVL